MRLLLLAFTSFLLALAPALADNTPSEAAKAYYETMKAKDYNGAAKLFDPEALKSFRGILDFLTDLPDEEGAEVLVAFFGEGATKESVKKLSASEFFAAFFKGVMSQAEEEAGGVDFGEVKVVGEVPEGGDVVHVVTRNKTGVGELKIESMEVMSFKKTEAGWKALLNGEMIGMAAQLKESFGK